MSCSMKGFQNFFLDDRLVKVGAVTESQASLADLKSARHDP